MAEAITQIWCNYNRYQLNRHLYTEDNWYIKKKYSWHLYIRLATWQSQLTNINYLRQLQIGWRKRQEEEQAETQFPSLNRWLKAVGNFDPLSSLCLADLSYSPAIKPAACFSSRFLFLHLDIRAMKYSFGFFPFFPALGHPYFLNLAYEGAGRASSLFPLETKADCTMAHSGCLLQLSREATQQGCNNSEKFTALKVNQSPTSPAVIVTGFNKAACYNSHCHAF